jgi:ubiquinone/menaquinone biosynthesis C-methylase UbiE
MLGNTKQHKKYWKDRKIDWNQSYLVGVDPVSNQPMWNHPHRQLICYALNSFKWYSLWELGVGAGANLMKIIQTLGQNHQLGGSDINEDAIESAKKTFVGGLFHHESSEDILLSNKSVDVMLSDAHLIYFGPTKIRKVIKEMTRTARLRLVLCELHEPSLWKRWVYRFKTGYNVYDYRKLLESEDCYNVQTYKIPKDFWPGEPWAKYGHIIIAQLP